MANGTTDVRNHDTLDFWHWRFTSGYSPPIGAHVHDFLVLVPQYDVITAGVWHVETASKLVDVSLGAQNVRRHNRNTGVELQHQYFESEARSWDFEGHNGRQLIHSLDFFDVLVKLCMVCKLFVLHLAFEGEHNVLGSDSNAVAPLGIFVHLDGQLGEVGLGVVHAVGQPHHRLVGEDCVVSQWLPQQCITVLVRVTD